MNEDWCELVLKLPSYELCWICGDLTTKSSATYFKWYGGSWICKKCSDMPCPNFKFIDSDIELKEAFKKGDPKP